MLDDGENISQQDESPLNDDSRPPQKPDEKTLKTQVEDLVADARKLALAEVEYYRAKLTVNMAATKTALILFGVSVVLGITTLIALILGSLLILSSYFGPIAATGIVTGICLLVSLILMSMSIKRVRKLPLDENEK